MIIQFAYITADEARKLIAAGADVNAKNEHGTTPLHCAASREHADVARLLLEAGAEVNAQAKYGWTPLHFAAMNGRIETARVLIAAGADPSIRNNIGYTPADICDPEIAHVFSSSGN